MNQVERRSLLIRELLKKNVQYVDAPMTRNLRCDDTFVQDEGWYAASERYYDFIRRHKKRRILFFELGAGANTPVFRFLSIRNKLRKNTVKQQILDISHDKTREYEERRCA